MKSIAFYATLDNGHTDLHGIALRANDGSVHFKDDALGLWTELCDRDIPRLHLHGRMDLADAQALLDGNLVVKASRTMQRAA